MRPVFTTHPSTLLPPLAVNLSGITFDVIGTSDGATVISELGITGPSNSTVLTSILFATVTSITFSATVAASTAEAGYESADLITGDIGLENVMVLFNTQSSTDNA